MKGAALGKPKVIRSSNGIEAVKKTAVLAKILLIIFKLCSLVRQVHDYIHSLVNDEANARS